eukprot:s16_g42.t2
MGPRPVPMLVANPDVVRPDGNSSPMPGRLAQRYRELGGPSAIFVGKPHPEVFQLARERLQEAGVPSSARVCMVGDSVWHDVRGARAAGLDVLLLSSGVHSEALGIDQAPAPPRRPAAESLRGFLGALPMEDSGQFTLPNSTNLHISTDLTDDMMIVVLVIVSTGFAIFGPGANAMDALHCATFMCTYPLNNIAACLTVTALAVARGGIYLRSAIAAYVCWILLDPSPTKGGYEWLWKLGVTDMLRRSWFWRSAAQYFPVTLKATAPVPAEKGPYIFVCHPHGIIGVSPMTSFGTDASGFNQTFPGVRVHLLGHNAIFRIPLFREWCLMHGHGSAGRDTCLYLLRRGDSIALAPGGAKESLECEPGTMRLVLQNRKGFARLALRTGAALVPVLGFGENDLYSTVQFEKHTWGRAIQERLQRRPDGR